MKIPTNSNCDFDHHHHGENFVATHYHTTENKYTKINPE
jgi:hypothetical protein